MVVNLVRSGRKQPQLFSASAGGTARHPLFFERAMKKLSLAAAAIAAMIASSAALAFGTSVELANGDDVNMGRIGLQWWEWQSQRFRSENWHFGGYTEFSVGYWHTNDVKPGEHSSLV